MKLFTPRQVQEDFKTKQNTDLVQIGYLETTLKRLQDQINKETENYTKRLQEQRDTYGAEKMQLQADLRQLEGSVKILREQRAALMIPVKTLQAEVEEMHDRATKRLHKLDVREEALNVKIELVTSKLDELSERELKVQEQEQRIALKKEGIEAESAQVSEGHKRLNGMMADFNQEVSRKTEEISKEKSALEIEKKRVQEYLSEREQTLTIKEIQLVDREKALERNINRIKNKQNGRQK